MNDECRNNVECRNPNVETGSASLIVSTFVIRFSDLIRHSDFDIRHSPADKPSARPDPL
jgi:hypothetical protein